MAQRELEDKFRLTRNGVPPPCRLLIVQRAADGKTGLIQDVSVNHRGGNVLMSKQLLDGTDIVATFKQVRGKAVAECVAAGSLGNARLLDGEFDGVLQVLLGNVMPAEFARARIAGEFGSREHVLPRPRAISVAILAFQSERQIDPPVAVGKIALVECADVREMQLQRSPQPLWQQRYALAQPFAVANCDLAVTEINVFDAQAYAFHETQPSAIRVVRPSADSRHAFVQGRSELQRG